LLEFEARFSTEAACREYLFRLRRPVGFDPAALPFLTLGERKGFGTRDVDSIWTWGNAVDEAHWKFRQPSRWHAPASGASSEVL